MLGFIKVSQAAGPRARKKEPAEERFLPLREAIAIVVMTALFALAFGIRLWLFIPHGGMS